MTRREVKRFFRRRRIHQAAVARAVGVSGSMLSRWLAGEAISRPLKEKVEAYVREQSKPVEHVEGVAL